MSNTLRFARVVICIAATVGAGKVCAVECTLVEANNSSRFKVVDRIVRSGNYCLARDVNAPRVYDFGGERAYQGALLAVQASQVDIDLHSFAIHADALRMPAISLGHAYGTMLHQLTVRNGRLISRTRYAIGFPELLGTTPADFRVVYQKPSSAEEAYAEFRDKWVQESAAMQPSDILIDEITIRANTRTDGRICADCFGAALKGRRNVIRNSRIEISNGQAGVLFVGPDNLIEHCTIIFKGKAATAAAAAIKLYGAHNTVIRDNDIVIEADDDAAPVAILLTDSKNVTLEGNRFYGVKTVTRMDEQSSYAVERGNQSLSRFKALFLK